MIDITEESTSTEGQTSELAVEESTEVSVNVDAGTSSDEIGFSITVDEA